MTPPFFRPKGLLKAPERIIISRTDKIGDIVLSIPAFFMAKKMYPLSHLKILASDYNAPVISGLSFIDSVLIADKNREKETLEKIKDFAPEVFIALYSDGFTAKAAYKSHAAHRIGPLSKPLSWLVYNGGIVQKRSRSLKNEAEYNLDLVRACDEKLFDRLFEIGGKISYNKNNEEKAADYLRKENIKGKFILLCPFDGGSAKNFTPEEYVRVASIIMEKAPQAPIVLAFSEKDLPRAFDMKIKLPQPNLRLYKNGADIMDLAALIDKAEVYAGASTGPTHIAGNLGKKVVAVYPAKPSQSPARWGLFGNEKTEYIIPDLGLSQEDYSVKNFCRPEENFLFKMAEAIVKKFKDG